MARVVFTSGPASESNNYVLRGQPVSLKQAQAALAFSQWCHIANVAHDVDTIRVYLPNGPQTPECLLFTMSIELGEDE